MSDLRSIPQMTTGGTESILLACKTYRDYAREVKGVTRPEIVMPVTAHAAFEKAAQYLNIKIRIAPVNEQSFTVSIKAMKRMITRNTIMVRTVNDARRTDRSFTRERSSATF